MSGRWSLCRFGSCLLAAVLLVTALTAPAAARDVACPRLWEQIELESVTAVEPVAVWDAGELLSYGDGKDNAKVTVGELEVKFRPLTRTDFDGYRITATPSEDDPGTSAELGIEAQTRYVSHAQAREAVRLNLEPGTKYYVEVVAINEGLGSTEYILSHAQKTQDQAMAVTWLSPPFLGGYSPDRRESPPANQQGNLLHLPNPAAPGDRLPHRGTHYLVHMRDPEVHMFRWLNPAWFGPYDHVWKREGEGADMLCMNEDGDVGVCPKAAADRGITHYRAQIVDVATGSVEYRQNVVIAHPNSLTYRAFFNLEDGTYDFSVHAGRLDDGTWRPMSGKAVVRFEVTDDYNRYNQSWREWREIRTEIEKGLTTEEDYEAWFDDSPWRHYGDQISGAGGAASRQTRFRNPSTASPTNFYGWPNAEANRYATPFIAYLNIIYD